MKEYHIIMLFQRKKDIPELNKSTKCVFQDMATKEQILERKEIYEELAKKLRARVYVSASPRDIRKARKRLLVRLIQTEDEGQEPTNMLAQAIGSLMEFPIKEKKRFVIDIDTKDKGVVERVKKLVPVGVLVETQNGFHYITEPFDVRTLEDIEDVEVKRDGMTTIEYLEKVQHGCRTKSRTKSR